MSQSIRQKAPSAVQEQLIKRRGAMAAREASAALLERERVVTDTERRMGEALVALTTAEGLPLAEATARCGLDAREAARLARSISGERPCLYWRSTVKGWLPVSGSREASSLHARKRLRNGALKRTRRSAADGPL